MVLKLLAGPALALVAGLLLPEAVTSADGSVAAVPIEARIVAALTVWMAVWWLTEALPLYVTGLLPLAVLPLTGAVPMEQVAQAYGDPLLFLFLGGFILALAIERWGLHRRIAVTVLESTGPRPAQIVGAFLGLSGFISLWITNTATAMLLMPVALSVLTTTRDPPPALRTALPLAVAWGASIGGMGTIIGTAPNIFTASFLANQLGRPIGFVEWLSFGLPVACLLLIAAWLLLTRVALRLPREPLPRIAGLLERLRADLGPVSTAERRTALVFGLTALAWFMRSWLAQIEWSGSRPLAGLTDAGIAILAAVLLFVVPAGRHLPGEALMRWEQTARLPWGLLLLFGGGLALAAAFESSGLVNLLAVLGGYLPNLPLWLVILAVVSAVVFLSEITSNAATAATVIPALAAVAVGAGLAPLPVVLAACLAASGGFMLPVATPPNAIAYGTGLVPAGQMARIGFLLNLAGIVCITLVSCAIMVPLFNSR